jgi:hypothetical protein
MSPFVIISVLENMCHCLKGNIETSFIRVIDIIYVT